MAREYCPGAKQPARELPDTADRRSKYSGKCAVCGGEFQLTNAGRPYPHKVPLEKLPSESPATPTDQDLGL
jgi:hypothetical protein